MARRNGRKGDYLMTDDYTGFTRYASELHRDYWGAYARKPLLRNLQEIASPLSDPESVPIFRGPNYEQFNPCDAEIIRATIGNTGIPTNPNNMAAQVLGFASGIGTMSIECTFIVS